jgi:PPP family 3-phenylpropionic acid transporter
MQMRKIWPFSFNVFLFAGFAFAWPFLVLYYQSLGFSGAQIGLLVGITPLITLVSTPLWTSLADATGRHRLVMSLTLLAAAITLFALPFFNIFAPILLIAILSNIFISPVTSFSDSATMYMLADQKAMYGRIRLGGTFGYGLAAYLAGALVQSYGLRLAFWGSALLFLLALMVGQKLVHNPQRASESTRRGIGLLITNPRWLLFLAVAFAGGLALAAGNTYFFPYLEGLGASESIMGLALMIGTLAEIPVFYYGHHLVRRFKSYGLYMLAMALTGMRLLALAVCTTPTQAILVQLLNMLTFPAWWIAGVAYADENAPTGLSATAQGMFGMMVFGFGAAMGGFIGGPLLESIGGRGLYFVYGAVVLVIVAVAALLYRRLPQTSQVQENFRSLQ